MPHKLTLGTAEGNFLPYALLVIPGKLIALTVIVGRFIGDILQRDA